MLRSLGSDTELFPIFENGHYEYADDQFQKLSEFASPRAAKFSLSKNHSDLKN